MSTQQQKLVTVEVDGRSLGVFDSHTPGDVDGNVQKHRPGGMGTEESYGSLPTHGNITVSRSYKRDRDHELTRWLLSRVGKARGAVSVQQLDEDGNAWGRPKVYKGRLNGYSDDGSDSDSSDPTMYELEFVVETVA